MSTYDQDRVEFCTRLLADAATAAGLPLSGDMRVSESDAATLLGLHPGSLKNLRSEGCGPVAYRTPMNGSRWSYRLLDLARWIEERRESC